MYKIFEIKKSLKPITLIIILINVFGFIGCTNNDSKNAGNFSQIQTNTHSFFASGNIAETQNLAFIGLMNYFKQDGSFEYIYYYNTSSFSDKNNIIRQLLASRVLAYYASSDSSLLAKHQKNLNFLFDNVYFEEGDKGYIFFDNKSKLGANALMLRLLIASPYYEKYKNNAKSLYKGLISLRNPREGLEPRYRKPNYEYDKDYLLTFYSGEALTAIMEYYRKTKDPDILKTAKQIQDYYIDKYVDNLDKNYYPAYVPWHTISLNLLYKATGDKKYYNAIKMLNNKLLEIQDTSDNPNTKGRFYNPKTPQYGSPHSSSDGVYTEGLLYALEIAKIEKDSAQIKKLENAIKIGFENITNLQYQDTNNLNIKGHIKINLNNNDIRIDTTAHSLEAMIKYEELMVYY